MNYDELLQGFLSEKREYGPTYILTSRKGYDELCRITGRPNKFRLQELRSATKKMKPRNRRPTL